MLAKMRAVVEPTHLMVVWDGGLSAERLAALPEYKAQRPEMPADLKPQFDGMTDYLQAAGIASFCQDGVEADDYIAGLARRAAEAGLAVVIASSDKDFMQLVSGRIGLLNPNDKTETDLDGGTGAGEDRGETVADGGLVEPDGRQRGQHSRCARGRPQNRDGIAEPVWIGGRPV